MECAIKCAVHLPVRRKNTIMAEVTFNYKAGWANSYEITILKIICVENRIGKLSLKKKINFKIKNKPLSK